MPEAQIRSDARAHFLLMFPFIVLLKLLFEVLKKFCRDNKEALLVLKGLVVLIHIRDVGFFGFWPKVGEYFERAGSDIFVDGFSHFLKVLFLF